MISPSREVVPASSRPQTLGDRALATRAVKHALGQLVYRSGLHRAAWRNRAVIVLFHRIDDRYPHDPITCTRARFAAFCDFFERYFKIVSLSALLDSITRGENISRQLVITFDDGYRDNYEFAAAELKRRGLPACFFVATSFVGSRQAAWWDVQQAIPSEWMTWDDVRALRDQGFELGAHTRTHADCGCLVGEDARREIVGSKSQLESELGRRIAHFAFPYGSAARMTETNRTLVQASGFSCCLAADYGVVSPCDDPYRLDRIPINRWFTTPYQFGFEALRLALEAPSMCDDAD